MGNKFLSLNKSQQRTKTKYSNIKNQKDYFIWTSKQQDQLWQTLWKQITHQNLYYRRQYGKFHIYRNQTTSQEVEQHRIVLNDKEQYQKCKQIINWRNHNEYLVKVQHFQIENQGQLCVSQYQMNIFLERIPLRLSDLTDIPFPENLYFMLAAIKGFKYIFSYPYPLKPFNVSESMIGVNKQGLIKVWLNPNTSQMLPTSTKQPLLQEDILKNIIDLIEQNTDQKQYPYPFRQYLYDKKIIVNGDFNLIIQQLYAYAKDMKVMIPKYAFSVRDVLQRDFVNTAKVQTQNSTNQIIFRDQSQSFRKQNQSYILNNEELQIKTNNDDILIQQQAYQVSSQNSFFPKQKLHGLTPLGKRQNNQQNKIYPINTIHKKEYEEILQRQSPQKQTLQQPPIDKVLNFHIIQNQGIKQNHSNHFINRIGNNITQYRNNEAPMEIQNNRTQFSRQKHARGSASIDINKKVQSINCPPGYRVVQKQIIHPLNLTPSQFERVKMQHESNGFNLRNNTQSPLLIQQSMNQGITHYLPAQQLPFNQRPFQFSANSQIQRVNSVRIQNFQFPKFPSYLTQEQVSSNQFRHQKYGNLLSQVPLTVRPPTQLANTVKIQRINRQSSLKGSANTSSKQSFNKTNSFKNNLIKSQHQNYELENSKNFAGDLKYFTKKDSQQTLDPQIAADLLKYMNNNENQ